MPISDPSPEDSQPSDHDRDSVIAAFASGHEATQGEWRSLCREHDTAGVIRWTKRIPAC
jgi:uncharacterized protein YbcV (DUF1398 family)